MVADLPPSLWPAVVVKLLETLEARGALLDVGDYERDVVRAVLIEAEARLQTGRWR